MKIGLGTVQFGIDYGITNRGGKTAREEVVRILDIAVRNGIRFLDTAAQYGDSEKVLGATLPPHHAFNIVTKTPSFRDAVCAHRASLLSNTFKQSLQHLHAESIYGLLIHHADDLIGDSGRILMDRMLELKEQRLVRKIGVSVYTADQIDQVLEQYAIDLVQLPVNVLDQRLLKSGHLAVLKAAGIEIHARSAFLQGLLLMEPATVPHYFDSIRQHLTAYHENLRLHGLTPVQSALGFLTRLDEIDVVICGVNNHSQFVELCAAASLPVKDFDFNRFAIYDEMIINPSNWKL